MKTTIEVYPRKVRGKTEYFWRMKRKGRVTADGAESYKRKSTLLRVLKGIISGGFTLKEL